MPQSIPLIGPDPSGHGPDRVRFPAVDRDRGAGSIRTRDKPQVACGPFRSSSTRALPFIIMLFAAPP
jgi:hypothetical protein